MESYRLYPYDIVVNWLLTPITAGLGLANLALMLVVVRHRIQGLLNPLQNRVEKISYLAPRVCTYFSSTAQLHSTAHGDLRISVSLWSSD